jgi:hypothetical protein
LLILIYSDMRCGGSTADAVFSHYYISLLHFIGAHELTQDMIIVAKRIGHIKLNGIFANALPHDSVAYQYKACLSESGR